MSGEQLAYQSELLPNPANRRTDDILYPVRHLAANITDHHTGVFASRAEADILEHDITDISEADVHDYGAPVYQHLDDALGQYSSLGMGTVEHARRGKEALDQTDPTIHFEYLRREVEELDEYTILTPEVNVPMRQGATKLFVSAAPTHHEADPDVAVSLNYDDRTMVRLQGLTPDGRTKIMKSYCVFDVPTWVWAKVLEVNTSGEYPTSLEVMQSCADMLPVNGTFDEVLEALLESVKPYLSKEQKASVEAQQEAFRYDQERLKQQVEYYAHERLAFQKELALSMGGTARPAVLRQARAVIGQLNETDQTELSKRMYGNSLYVDEFVAELLLKVKTVMTDNRAGLAARNERTVKRMASAIGLESTIDLALNEARIHEAINNGASPDLLVRNTEAILAVAGVSCGGGCSVDIVNLFSAKATQARKAGLKGTLYELYSLDKKSKCTCAGSQRKAKVVSDGKNVVCLTCGDYERAGGKRGNLEKAA